MRNIRRVADFQAAHELPLNLRKVAVTALEGALLGAGIVAASHGSPGEVSLALRNMDLATAFRVVE